jgi:hypothetical protein
MFRNVYGYGKKDLETPQNRMKFIEEATRFIDDNDIIAIHEIVNDPKSVKFFKAQYNHSYNPSIYFRLPDGTEPIPPAIGKKKFISSETAFLDMLKQLMATYEEWKKKQ